jgi:hypothetical protein
MRRVKRQHLLAARAAGLVGLRLRPRATSRAGDAEQGDEGGGPSLVPPLAPPQRQCGLVLEAVTTFCYDSLGRRIATTDWFRERVIVSTNGPLATPAQPQDGPAFDNVTTFCYDSLGELRAPERPGSAPAVKYTCDALGRRLP